MRRGAGMWARKVCKDEYDKERDEKGEGKVNSTGLPALILSI